METKILIALITSVASIVVAIISLVSNYINNKKIIKANQSLESIKLVIDKKRSLYKIFDKNLKNSFSVLGDFIKHIQIFKDNLLLIENSTEDSLDSETILKETERLRKNMFLCYEEKSQYLNDGALKSAHSAKNNMITIENMLKKLLSEREYVNISEDERQYIENNRIILTDFQNVLRDNRLKILSEVS